MKKILTYILIVLIIVAVAIVVLGQSKDKPIVIEKGNLAHKPLPIKLNKTNDTECAMLIKTEENAAEVVAPNGDTWFLMILDVWLSGYKIKSGKIKLLFGCIQSIPKDG